MEVDEFAELEYELSSVTSKKDSIREQIVESQKFVPKEMFRFSSGIVVFFAMIYFLFIFPQEGLDADGWPLIPDFFILGTLIILLIFITQFRLNITRGKSEKQITTRLELTPWIQFKEHKYPVNKLSFKESFRTDENNFTSSTLTLYCETNASKFVEIVSVSGTKIIILDGLIPEVIQYCPNMCGCCN